MGRLYIGRNNKLEAIPPLGRTYRFDGVVWSNPSTVYSYTSSMIAGGSTGVYLLDPNNDRVFCSVSQNAVTATTMRSAESTIVPRGIALDNDGDLLVLSQLGNVWAFRNGSRHSSKDISFSVTLAAHAKGICVAANGDVIIGLTTGGTRFIRNGVRVATSEVTVNEWQYAIPSADLGNDICMVGTAAGFMVAQVNVARPDIMYGFTNTNQAGAYNGLDRAFNGPLGNSTITALSNWYGSDDSILVYDRTRIMKLTR